MKKGQDCLSLRWVNYCGKRYQVVEDVNLQLGSEEWLIFHHLQVNGNHILCDKSFCFKKSYGVFICMYWIGVALYGHLLGYPWCCPFEWNWSFFVYFTDKCFWDIFSALTEQFFFEEKFLSWCCHQRFWSSF
jgi:hypothetical protein